MNRGKQKQLKDEVLPYSHDYHEKGKTGDRESEREETEEFDVLSGPD
jgi:hypothetical protein